MALVHPTAFVDPKAELADGVVVGPFCFVDAGVVLGPETVLESHVTIRGGTRMGARNRVYAGAVLGGDPQDRRYAGEPTYLVIGDGNTFREYVTIHRATGEGKQTTVGNDCYIMAYCHFGHNVTIHDGVTLANSVGVAGYATIEERVNMGGFVGIHQFARVGKYSMIGGMSGVSRDVPPFTLSAGTKAEVLDINAVGLRRLGVTPEARMALHKAVKLLFKSELGLTNALEIVKREVPITPEVAYLIAFEERRFQGKSGRADQP